MLVGLLVLLCSLAVGGGEPAPPAGWSELARPPALRSSAVWLWTGSSLLRWGGDTDYDAVHHDDGAIYDPGADAWRALPAGPLEGRSSAAAVWTGTEALVWGGTAREPKGDGAAYAPATGAWRLLPPSPLTPRLPATGVWTGRELIAWDYGLAAAAYDPAADGWTRLPDVPLDFYECYPQGGLAAGLVFAWHCGQAALFDPAARAWWPLHPPSGLQGALVPAGPAVVVAGEEVWRFAPR